MMPDQGSEYPGEDEDAGEDSADADDAEDPEDADDGEDEEDRVQTHGNASDEQDLW